MSHEQQVEQIKSALGTAVVAVEFDSAACPIVWAKRENVIQVLSYLKEGIGCEYRFMADLTAYDEQGSSEESKSRFVVVYNLFSPQSKLRIRVKVRLQENEALATASELWPAANWAEREVFDMFGIRFDGHPDLRRILMDIRWEGHPLRKDYPLRRYQLFNDPELMPEHLLKD